MWSYNYYSDSDYLSHYGILGMKWGIRRTPAQLGHDTSSGRKKKTSGTSDSASSKPKKKRLKDMTDDEIKEKVARLKLEKEYKQLLKETSPDTGKDYVVGILKKIGDQTLTNLGTQAANHVLGNAINKAAGVKSSDAQHRVVNPQKGQSDKK